MHKHTILLLLLITASSCSSVPQDQADPRIAVYGSLFTGAEQYENFNRMTQVAPTTTLTAAADPYEFPLGETMILPTTYVFRGKQQSTEDFLRETDTSALLVIKDGVARSEQYWLTGGHDVNWLSMSVAKSFISALIGIAVAEGHITSIDEPITRYVADLAGSAYDGVPIRDILQMSSGARWLEEYGNPDADIARLGEAMAPGGSFKAFLTTVVPEVEPGTRNLYNSADTQALGFLLSAATGQSITEYMQQKLWEPMGAEYPGYWITDDEGMEMAFGGLNLTARDYAKLGEMYRNNGQWRGQQIIPEDWVKASIVADAPHLTVDASDFGMGYGYQWWLMDNAGEEYSAIGVYNQFIYVNRPQNLVIVKLSANSQYAQTDDESSFRELESIAFFRAIGDALSSE